MISEDLWPSGELDRELDRVGVTLVKSVFDHGLVVLEPDEWHVTIFDPLDVASHHSWGGTEPEALDLLSTLPDGAGPEAFWAVFADSHS